MEYNTQRPHLELPEYGRNVQLMIEYAITLPTKEERNAAALAIIDVMAQLKPQLDVEDYKHKLWTHLFVMADFRLDVDSPYEIPEKEELGGKPSIMHYPQGKIAYGHYGKYTEEMIKKISEMEDGDEKEEYKETIANFMKQQFLSYNNKSVENRVIAEHLAELSKGALTLSDPDQLKGTSQLLKNIRNSNISNASPSNNRKKQKNQHRKFNNNKRRN